MSPGQKLLAKGYNFSERGKKKCSESSAGRAVTRKPSRSVGHEKGGENSSKEKPNYEFSPRRRRVGGEDFLRSAGPLRPIRKEFESGGIVLRTGGGAGPRTTSGGKLQGQEH